MKTRFLILSRTAVLACLALCGCREFTGELHYIGESELEHYKHVATEVAASNLVTNPQPEILNTDAPYTVHDKRRAEPWDLALAEALHTALANNKIIRQVNDRNTLLANSANIPSVYDVAIQETNVLFGGRGIEGALSAFDAQLSTSMHWSRDETFVNSAASPLAPEYTLITEGTSPSRLRSASARPGFDLQIQKTLATGGDVTFSHNWIYTGTNLPGQVFPSRYEGSIGLGVRQPLLAGSGVDYVRTAGPANPGLGAITGVSQGVVIARINNDITIADFEAAVRNMLLDVENAYWDLYLTYRIYDSAITARNSALRSWREAKATLEAGGLRGFKPADEAQARDQYFDTRAQAEIALNNLYSAEIELRRLMGLPVNDGRIIRPVDEPTSAEFKPDWEANLFDALTHRVELRKQKWNIKSLQLQLNAARSLVRPSLDFAAEYHVNGFGDKLISQADGTTNPPTNLRSAYEVMTEGDKTGWTMGFQFDMPLGFRFAKAQVRNYELRLAKAQAALTVQEREVSLDLAATMQRLAVQYQTSQTYFNRLLAARDRVSKFESEVEVGTATLDALLRAQSSLANASNSYYTSLAEYNKALAELHFQKGTLLEYNKVFLGEGGWEPDAYDEALRRAWARSYALKNPLLETQPPEFALPEPVPYPGLNPNGETDDVPLPVDAAPLGGPGVPGPLPDGLDVPIDPSLPPITPQGPGDAPPTVPPVDPFGGAAASTGSPATDPLKVPRISGLFPPTDKGQSATAPKQAAAPPKAAATQQPEAPQAARGTSPEAGPAQWKKAGEDSPAPPPLLLQPAGARQVPAGRSGSEITPTAFFDDEETD